MHNREGLRCEVQTVQDMMLAEVHAGVVQGVQRRCRGGAGEVQGRCRGCRDGRGYLHRLHLNKHEIRCRRLGCRRCKRCKHT